jgi:hypothetical protein
MSRNACLHIEMFHLCSVCALCSEPFLRLALMPELPLLCRGTPQKHALATWQAYNDASLDSWLMVYVPNTHQEMFSSVPEVEQAHFGGHIRGEAQRRIAALKGRVGQKRRSVCSSANNAPKRVCSEESSDATISDEDEDGGALSVLLMKCLQSAVSKECEGVMHALRLTIPVDIRQCGNVVYVRLSSHKNQCVFLKCTWSLTR